MRETLFSLFVFLVLPLGVQAAGPYYFSDCASGGSGTKADPYCLDPGSGNNPAGNESFDYLMDGAAPEVAAGETIYLCAGPCDGAGTATYHLAAHGSPATDNSSCPSTSFLAAIDYEVDGSSGSPITIQPYCENGSCEKVVLSGDTNNNNAYDANESNRFINNVDCDGSTYAGHGGYVWNGDPNNDRVPDLVIEKADWFAFVSARTAGDITYKGMEIRYIDRLFFGCTGNDCDNLGAADGAHDVGCTNDNGDRGTAFSIKGNNGRVIMDYNWIHHICFTVIRSNGNCLTSPSGSDTSTAGCTSGQITMDLTNNKIWNAGAVLNAHQGRNWNITGNEIWDTFDGIGVEEQVVSVNILDNNVSCRGDYNVNLTGSAFKCRTGIYVSDGEVTGTACFDDNSGPGYCTTKDIVIARNKVWGKGYSATAGNGTLLGGIFFRAHNSQATLGNTRIENNFIWHVQDSDGNFNVSESPLSVTSVDAVIVQNNTIYDSGPYAYLANAAHTFRNNLIVHTHAYAGSGDVVELKVDASAAGGSIQNNNLSSGGGSSTVATVGGTNYTCGSSWSGYQSGNRCNAASFVNTSGGKETWNLHLQSSPANSGIIDGGTTGASNDIDNQTRSGAVDIGADEVGSPDSTKPRAPTNLQVQ